MMVICQEFGFKLLSKSYLRSTHIQDGILNVKQNHEVPYSQSHQHQSDQMNRTLVLRRKNKFLKNNTNEYQSDTGK